MRGRRTNPSGIIIELFPWEAEADGGGEETGDGRTGAGELFPDEGGGTGKGEPVPFCAKRAVPAKTIIKNREAPITVIPLTVRSIFLRDPDMTC